jgi:hypothetical protein
MDLSWFRRLPKLPLKKKEIIKMKKRLVIVMAIMLMIFLFALSGVAYAGMVYNYKLMVGQDEFLGQVSVWNTDDTLYVHYRVWSPSHCLVVTHVHVADSVEDIPHNQAGPIPGHFDYQMVHDCSTPEAEYAIPLSAGGWEIGDRVVIAAHAEVGQPTDPYWRETGWGIQCGDFDTWSFPGTKWAAYMEYPIHE